MMVTGAAAQATSTSIAYAALHNASTTLAVVCACETAVL